MKKLLLGIVLSLLVFIPTRVKALVSYTIQESFEGISGLEWVTNDWVNDKISYYENYAISNLNDTTRTHYIITTSYLNAYSYKRFNFNIFYLNENDFSKLSFAETMPFDNNNGYSIGFNITKKLNPTRNDFYLLENEYFSYDGINNISSSTNDIRSGRYVESLFTCSSSSHILFKNIIVSSNVNYDILNNMDYYVSESGSGYTDFEINNEYYSNSNGFKFKYNKHFSIYSGGLDTEAPVITLNGDNVVYIDERDSYYDLGATAYDNVDGDLTDNIIVISNVNPNIPGTYSVTYSVEDSSGNIGQVIRTVIVNDKYTTIFLDDNIKRVVFWYKNYSDLVNSSYTTDLTVNGSFLYKHFDITFSLENYEFGHLNDISNSELLGVSNITSNKIPFTNIPIGNYYFEEPIKFSLSFYFMDNTKTAYFFDPIGGNKDTPLSSYFLDIDLTNINYAFFDNDLKLIYSSVVDVDTGNYKVDYKDEVGNDISIDPDISGFDLDKYLKNSANIFSKIGNSLNHFRESILLIFSYITYFYLQLPLVFQMFILSVLGLTFFMFIIGILF